MPGRASNVLFLCTGNSARSILAERAMNRSGEGRARAGSGPVGQVNPDAVELRAEMGHPTQGFHSKRWDGFATPDAPALDVVVTVCPDAAGEVRPIWRGRPLTAHWEIEGIRREWGGDDIERRRAFGTALRDRGNRNKLRTGPPIDKHREMAPPAKVRETGQAEGPSSPRSDLA